MLLCHCGTQSILSLCQREIGEFLFSVCVMAVFFSFKKRVTRLGGSLQKAWRLPLPGEERSTLKQRRLQRVQDRAGDGEEETTELENLQLNRKI